jgi:hypothetical protein
MSGNPFALLDNDPQEKKPSAVVAKKQQVQPKDKKAPVATAAAPKKDAKAVPQVKKPLASGERDRHTKGGRSEGEKTKRPFDRSVSRQAALGKGGQHERKGQDRSVKGGVGAKDPKADQVAADVDQKKDEEEKKEEEAKVEEVKEVKPEEPKPFLLDDAIKAKQKVAGERTKVRAATTTGIVANINSGSKPATVVTMTKKGQSKINPNKKIFNIDEFLAVQGGPSKVQPVQERTYQKRPAGKDFPSF